MPNTIPPGNPLSYLGVDSENPPNIIRAQRNPGPFDLNHKIGDSWINSLQNTAYILTSVSDSRAIWTQSSSSGGAPITQYVVAADGSADYITIQSALDAIGTTGPGQVYIRPGTYTENLIFPDPSNITLITGGDLDAAAAHLIGEHTPPDSGNLVIWRVKMTSSSNIFDSTSVGSTNITVSHNKYTVDGKIWNLPNWTGTLSAQFITDGSIENSILDNGSGSSDISIFECSIGVGLVNLMRTGAGNLEIMGCNIGTNCFFQTGTVVSISSSIFTQSLVFQNDSSGCITSCFLNTGNVDAITYNSSGELIISDVTIESTGVPVIDGTGVGIIRLGSVTFISESSISASLSVDRKSVVKCGLLDTKGLSVVEGSVDDRLGSVQLAAGTVTVPTAAVTNNSRIFLSRSFFGGSGFLTATNVIAATSFDIDSSSIVDNSIVSWMIVEPS